MKFYTVALLCLLGCHDSKQAGIDATAAVNTACTALEGQTDSGVVKIICASGNEIVDIVQFITDLRSKDTVLRKDVPGCTPVGTLCASKTELAKAIDMVVEKRGDKFKK